MSNPYGNHHAAAAAEPPTMVHRTVTTPAFTDAGPATVPAAEPPPPAPEPPEGPSGEEDGGGVLDLLERVGSVVVPLGVSLYAILYVAMQTLYATFGITPEQAGIEQSVLLGRLLYTIIMVALVAVPTLGVVVSLWWLLNKVTLGKAGKGLTFVREKPWAMAALMAVICGLIYWLLLPILEGFLGFTKLGEGVKAVFVATLVAIAAFVVPFSLLRRTKTGRALTKVICSLLAGLTMGFVLIGTVGQDAYKLATTAESSTTLSLVGFQDQWVYAEDDKGKPLQEGRPLLFLGEKEGFFVFWDCAELRTFRQFGEKVVITETAISPDWEFLGGNDFQCGQITE